MRKLIVGAPEAGQRLDHYLGRYLSEAPKSFLYKMLRKKNITLNGRKSEGSEKIQAGDEITLFLSEETILNFSKPEPATGMSPGERTPGRTAGTNPSGTPRTAGAKNSPALRPALPVLYENREVLFFNKPAGMLSQKARPEDYSVCEALTDRLLAAGELTPEQLRTFRPGVCNRLDRNTSGIIAAGKTVRGLQVLSSLLRERRLKKWYYCLCWGEVGAPGHLVSYHQKDPDTNTVSIRPEPPGDRVEIRYEPAGAGGGATLLKVDLLTGKSHQIRAQLAAKGFPIIGDAKYGNRVLDRRFAEETGYPLRMQLLHAGELDFPEECPEMPDLAGRKILAPLPRHFEKCRELLQIPAPEDRGEVL